MHTKTTLQQNKLFWAEDTRIFLDELRLDLSIDQGQLRGAAKVSNGQTDEAQNSRYGNNLTSKKTHKTQFTFPPRE
jgi:hypothetical protein